MDNSLKKKVKRSEKVARNATEAMEKVMHSAIDSVVDHAFKFGSFYPPTLNVMFDVMENFYRSVLVTATEDCKEQKKKKKLSFTKDPHLNVLEKIFRDKRYWPSIMKRSKKLTEKLRKAYLQKLKKKFDTLIPQIRANEITPKDAKKTLIEAWNATKSRVETIFRTETTKYFTTTQIKYFKDDDEILGFMFDSIADSSRTEICKSRHGMIYRKEYSGHDSIEYNSCPLHFNCRSHLIPLANTQENRKLLLDSSRDPRKNRGKIKPLPKGWK